MFRFRPSGNNGLMLASILSDSITVFDALVVLAVIALALVILRR